MTNSRKDGPYVYILLLSIFITLYSGGCSLSNSINQQKLKAEIGVKVEDADIRRLTNITNNVEIVATGEFASGTFFVNNFVVSIPPKTRFNLSLNLPIDDPLYISTEKAKGALRTSNQISVNTVPVPKTVELRRGEVSGQVDFARSMGAFFINLLQVGVVSGDMKDMLKGIAIEKVVLDLRPGSSIEFKEKLLHVGPNSRIALTNAIIDDKLNYVGDCNLDLTFAKGCKWIGEKVDCEFDGGRLQSSLTVKKFADRLVLSLPPKSVENKPVVLNNCIFRFGKNKRSNTESNTCSALVSEFDWQHIKGDEHPSMHLLAALDFSGTDLHLKTDIHETIGYFPASVPGRLEVNIKKSGRETHFATTAAARAQTGRITIAKKSTRLTLKLEDATIGPVNFDKKGAMHFELDKGVARLKELEWRAGQNKFLLLCGSGSTLSVPAEMLLENPGPGSKTQLDMPMKLMMGSATLQTPSGATKLAYLTGKILINVDKEIQLKSDLDFELKDLTVLNGYAATVKARGLNLSVLEGRTVVKMNRCSIFVPDEPLKEAIAKKIPGSFQLNLNKTIKEDKTWRYQNAVAKSVKVENLLVSDMHATSPGSLGFTASGDVVLDGTVDKGGIMFHKDKFETCPWSLSGHLTGTGTVSHKIESNPSGAGEVTYDLKMDLPIPDDVKLDWSKVAGGILKTVERKVIIGKLKQITIPLRHSGSLQLLEKSSPAWRNLQISQLAIKNAPGGGTEISFMAESASKNNAREPM